MDSDYKRPNGRALYDAIIQLAQSKGSYAQLDKIYSGDETAIKEWNDFENAVVKFTRWVGDK